MIINIIAAMAPNRVIGKDNKLPWDYPEDLQFFKKTTSWHTIVMGRNTYLSIGRPLPNRRNVILSKEVMEGLEYYNSIESMISKLEADWVDKIFIIWGMMIYQQFIDRADFIYLTEIKKEYEGDTFFPEFEDRFHEISREENENMDFVKYQKN